MDIRSARLLNLVALVSLWKPANGTAQQFGDFAFTNMDDAITITQYVGTNANASIPVAINGSPVLNIGNWAFFRCTNLASVSIPETVTNIGDYAFDGCSRLLHVTIPNTVISIGVGAFEECHNLTNVELSTNLTIIEAATFQSCYALANVFIPSSVTSIWSWAFSGCSNLASLTIPGSVANLGGSAFDFCVSLTNVTIPSSVTFIGDNPFPHCTSLTSIIVDAANLAYSSSEGTLFDKSQTTLIAAPGGNTGSYDIPYGVTTVATLSVAGCSRLTRVSIPGTVTNIQLLAFSDCASLTNVMVSSNVIFVGNGAFSSCFNLASLLFQGNAPEIGPADINGVFNGDTNATVYYLPGTSGWRASFGNRPALLWNPTLQTPRVQTNGLALDIAGTTNIPVQVEASTNLANGAWLPLYIGTLLDGRLHFSDASWTSRSNGFYRVGFP
jgi:hypothetical protein